MKLRIAVGAICSLCWITGVVAATHTPDFALAGSDPRIRWLTWGLAAAIVLNGMVHRPFNRLAGIGFALAGAALVLEEAGRPGSTLEVVFSVGLAVGGVAGGLCAAATAATSLTGRRRNALIVVALGGAVVGGPLVAIVRNPRSTGCFECQSNLLAIGDHPAVADLLASVGATIVLLSAACGLGLLLTSARRSPHQSPGHAGWAAAMWVASTTGVALIVWPRITDGANGAARGGLRAAATACLALAAVGLWIQAIELRRRRRALARLMTRVASAPLGDSLEGLLGMALDDPGLRLCYALDDGMWVDASGACCEFPSGPAVFIERQGGTIAVVTHSPGRFEDPGELLTAAAAVATAIDLEREAAMLASHGRILAGSRRRLIEIGDAERRALERDLHDHAQQRLVSILIGLQMQASVPGADTVALSQAAVEVSAALDGVRSIGHGIFPSLLADEGLAAALEELAAATDTFEITRLPDRRVDASIEATAYLIAETCGHVPVDELVSLSVENSADRLLLRADGVRCDEAVFQPLIARTQALGGTWLGHSGVVEVVLPCAS